MMLRSSSWRCPLLGLAIPLLAFAVVLFAAPSAQARIEVEDSPLFGRLLDDANSDLRDANVATVPWKTQVVAQAISDFVFAAPAVADSVRVTNIGEKTKCSNKKITQCDNGTGKQQACSKTTQAEKKTDCASQPGAATLCAAAEGSRKTRCPGAAKSNQCSTSNPGQNTSCQGEDGQATMCEFEKTECAASEHNTCVTQNPDKKSSCADGSEAPTVCRGLQTGCSNKNKNYCKTLSGGSTERTYCINNTNRTVCFNQVTQCTGGGHKPDSGCEFLTISLNTENERWQHVSSEDEKLLVVQTDLPFFGPGSEPFTGLQFNPPGPVVTDVNIFDQNEARFLVQIPPVGDDGIQDYDVIVFSGPNNSPTNGMLLINNPIPSSRPAGIAVLAAVLILVGSLLLVRRRGESSSMA